MSASCTRHRASSTSRQERDGRCSWAGFAWNRSWLQCVSHPWTDQVADANPMSTPVAQRRAYDIAAKACWHAARGRTIHSQVVVWMQSEVFGSSSCFWAKTLCDGVQCPATRHHGPVQQLCPYATRGLYVECSHTIPSTAKKKDTTKRVNLDEMVEDAEEQVCRHVCSPQRY